MLLRFGAENYLSIRDYQEISLMASSISDEASDTFTVGNLTDRVLPAIAFYGANASGKSNVLCALYALSRSVVASQYDEGGATAVFEQHFALDSAMDSRPTKFDCDFLLDGVRIHYGFTCNEDRVLEEWLYTFPKKYRQTWFHRSDEEKDGYYFGEHLKGQNRTIARLTRPNALFLSSAANNNHEQLTPIYLYFKDQLRFTISSRGATGSQELIASRLNDKKAKEKILRFLQYADIGVDDITIEEEPRPEHSEKFLKDLSRLMRKHVPDADLTQVDKLDPIKRIKLAHTGGDRSKVYLDWVVESRGTQTIMSLLGPVFDALDAGSVMIVDELETSTHPLVSQELVRLFCKKESNPNRAQLIFSTHDTNLLSPELLRRDQVWFAQKDSEGATELFPLTDIRTRKGDNIEKGYLEGRFGAVPRISLLGLDMLD